MRKLMLRFSGQEILIKTLQHLDLPLEPILSNSTTVPRIIPHLTAPLLSRSCRDRPKVVPQNTAKLAVVGQFVEIFKRTCATMDYSI
jgi:oleate hydratase